MRNTAKHNGCAMVVQPSGVSLEAALPKIECLTPASQLSEAPLEERLQTLRSLVLDHMGSPWIGNDGGSGQPKFIAVQEGERLIALTFNASWHEHLPSAHPFPCISFVSQEAQSVITHFKTIERLEDLKRDSSFILVTNDGPAARRWLITVSDGPVLHWNVQERLVTFAARDVTSEMTDPLTGLLNRYGRDHALSVLQTMAAQYGRGAETNGFAVGVLLLDLDLFKSINDTLGHAVGDLTLQAVAAVLNGDIRDKAYQAGGVAVRMRTAAGDTIPVLRREDFIIRYGGEEIIALLPMFNQQNPMAEAIAAAERVRERIQSLQLIRTAGSEAEEVLRTLSVSIGVTCISTRDDLLQLGDDQKLFSNYLETADAALYIAKQRGRNCVCYCIPGSPEPTWITPHT